MLIYLENLCCCCSNLVEAVEDLGQSSLKHILDNFVWIIAIVSLPGRILAALRRGRQLQQFFQFLEIEFDNVLLERKELQKQFQAALKEHKMMELMLDELEMIHEKATNKIALLESETKSIMLLSEGIA
ncbi:uncharacterized protein LOC127150141 [Cucumis melo]|uniref:Uncharacterized protein LOC127150141 n=1 Tax=Cucumis melo TaxID=3656 RepID=A0ABM3KYU7_CUCME|nr:uncharacterized protein LOC127150141 [Cucumis melo]XP_050942960.1 uncharacterized protein LOC127150141 [Cucumis melo]